MGPGLRPAARACSRLMGTGRTPTRSPPQAGDESVDAGGPPVAARTWRV